MSIKELLAVDSASIAAQARSIVSCPGAIDLIVDGLDDPLVGMERLVMDDVDGQPIFSCAIDSPLVSAARAGRSAVLTIDSGLGAPGSPARRATVNLAGRLILMATDGCECCGEPTQQVAIELNFVLLSRQRAGRRDEQLRAPLAEFRSPAHRLNPGYLQRAAEHANRCHQDELRHAIAHTAGLRVGDIGGVGLTRLRADGVQITWVDVHGANRRELAFSSTATTPRQLGDLLRRELHAGLC